MKITRIEGNKRVIYIQKKDILSLDRSTQKPSKLLLSKIKPESNMETYYRIDNPEDVNNLNSSTMILSLDDLFNSSAKDLDTMIESLNESIEKLYIKLTNYDKNDKRYTMISELIEEQNYKINTIKNFLKDNYSAPPLENDKFKVNMGAYTLYSTYKTNFFIIKREDTRTCVPNPNFNDEFLKYNIQVALSLMPMFSDTPDFTYDIAFDKKRNRYIVKLNILEKKLFENNDELIEWPFKPTPEIDESERKLTLRDRFNKFKTAIFKR